MPVLRSKFLRLVAGGLAGLAVLALAWLAADRLGRWQDARAAEAHVREIVALLDLEAGPDFHRRLDLVRAFINDHSERKLDDEFYANRRSAAVFAAGVLAHAEGRLSDPINMECSTRTRLMRAILVALGYRTRDVAIFDSHSNLKSHSFLEMRNPATGEWETQDADFDIYWRDTGPRPKPTDGRA